MNIIDNINRRYQSLLEAQGPEEMKARMVRDTVAAEALYMGNPLPYLIKPFFMEGEGRALCQRAAGPLMSAVDKITSALSADDKTRFLFFRGGPMDDSMDLPPPFPGLEVISRLDAYYYPENRGLKILEYNTDSPTGIGSNAAMFENYWKQGPVAELGKAFRLETDPMLESLNTALLEKYRLFCDIRKIEPAAAPHVVVVCSRHSKFRFDMRICADQLRRVGTDAVWADPRELEDDGRRLTLKGRDVHIILRDAHGDFVRSEVFGTGAPAARLRKPAAAWVRRASRRSRLVGRIFRRTPLGSGEAALRAYRDGRICMVNPFTARLSSFKAVMAYMSDGSFRHLLTEEELEVIARHLPWSRRLIESETVFHGEKIRLLPFVRANRERLVLKPNSGFGGHGVLIGRELENREWLDRIKAVLEAGTEYLVQEALPTPQDLFPIFEDGRYAGFQPRNVNLNLWVIDGKLAGTNIRASAGSIINVSQGGGVGLTFYVKGPNTT